MKCLTLSLFVAIGLTVSGCVPVPAVEHGSSAMRGRVVDSVTKLPVEGAVVSLHEYPVRKAQTDRDGLFRIRATHHLNILFAGGICGSEMPFGRDFQDVLDVRHPLYQTIQVDARQCVDQRVSEDSLVLRDIELTPISNQ
jgi:hypothetical protein